MSYQAKVQFSTDPYPLDFYDLKSNNIGEIIAEIEDRGYIIQTITEVYDVKEQS